MKKIVSIAIFSILTTLGFSQEAGYLQAKTESESVLQKSKSSGLYEFQFPTSLDKATVEKNAAFYTDYFSVQFDDKTKIAKLKMNENNEINRRVILRFLLSNNIKEINLDGKIESVEVFYKNHLN